MCTKCKGDYYSGFMFDNPDNDKSETCGHKCRDACTSCTLYNNCTQCIAGRYGFSCENVCSMGCMAGMCSRVTGECKCLPNFIGFKCEDCIAGKYGTFCNTSCSLQCKNRLCEKESGNCTNGCINSYVIGSKCTKCATGWSGEICDKECPKNCEIKGRNCRNELGHCLACRGNFSGSKCNNCKPGFYGISCDLSCSEQCLKSSCERLTGTCEAGCKEHYSGDKCCVHNHNCVDCETNFKCNRCESGYYGYSCENKCPVNCDGSCNLTSGRCDACKYGYYDSFCEVGCPEACGHASAENPCHRATGMCKFNCKIGAYGLTCNKTCSKYCIDDVCTQKTGVCVKGCNSSSKMFVCTGKPPATFDEKSSDVTIVVLSTFTVVFCFGFCVLVGRKIIKKVHTSGRQTRKTKFRVFFENSVAKILNKEVEDTVSAESVEYETIDTQHTRAEHKYADLDPKASDSTEVTNRVYVNLE